MSSSPHIDNKKKNILILGKGLIQGLEHALATNFTKINTTFYLSLHCNGANKHLFANGTEIIKFKAKDSEIVAYTLCLGKISKDIFVDNMKKIGLNRYIYNFSIDYNAIPVDDILDIHKYLMKKHDVK